MVTASGFTEAIGVSRLSMYSIFQVLLPDPIGNVPGDTKLTDVLALEVLRKPYVLR